MTTPYRIMPRRHVSTNASLLAWCIEACVLAAIAVAYAWFGVLTGFSFYDDEGTLIVMARWLLDGHWVYRDFHSIFGPFYFLYKWAAHTATGADISHITVRSVSMLVWASTALLSYAYVFALTRSRPVALLQFGFSLYLLAFIAAEPGHPQEICAPLLIALLWVFVVRPTRGVRASQLACAGAIVAALTLTKINLGFYVCAAVVAVALAATKPARGRRVLIGLAFAACFLTPVLVMSPVLGEAWGLGCCLLISISILLAIAGVLLHPPNPSIDRRGWGGLAFGLLGSGAFILGWALARGSSLNIVVQSILLDNLLLSHAWTVPFSVRWSATVTSACGLTLAMLCFRDVRRGRGTQTELLVELSKAVVGLSMLLLMAADQFGKAFTLSLPFVWLVVIPPRYQDGGNSQQFRRALLCMVTVMHSLYIYPVAGSQLRFTMLLLTTVACVCLHDALPGLAARLRWNHAARRWAGFATTAGLYCGLAIALAGRIQAYRNLPLLDLPGTGAIRVPAEQKAAYHWIADTVERSCDTFLTFPPIYSLYIWTGKMPPLEPDIDGWQAYSTSAQVQIAQLQASSASARTCVLYNRTAADFWLHHDPASHQIMLKYIEAHFREAGQMNGYRLMIRN